MVSWKGCGQEVRPKPNEGFHRSPVHERVLAEATAGHSGQYVERMFYGYQRFQWFKNNFIIRSPTHFGKFVMRDSSARRSRHLFRTTLNLMRKRLSTLILSRFMLLLVWSTVAFGVVMLRSK
jgi:hypothetical protein